MISEFVVFRLAKNDINFMKLDSTLKLKFYTKLKNDGLSKDKFFKLCFNAFMNDDANLIEVLQKEEYRQHIEEEYKLKKSKEEKLKKDNINSSSRFTSLRKVKEYDIEIYFDED